MIVFDKVAEFVNDHVVDEGLAYLHELEIERDHAIGPATAPARFHEANGEFERTEGRLEELSFPRKYLCQTADLPLSFSQTSDWIPLVYCFKKGRRNL